MSRIGDIRARNISAGTSSLGDENAERLHARALCMQSS